MVGGWLIYAIRLGTSWLFRTVQVVVYLKRLWCLGLPLSHSNRPLQLTTLVDHSDRSLQLTTRSVYPGNRRNEAVGPSVDTSEEVIPGSTTGKLYVPKNNACTSQNSVEDSLLDRPSEADSVFQISTGCVNDVMELSVNAEVAVPGPAFTQELLLVSTTAGAVLKTKIKEVFTVPACVESVMSDIPEGNRSGVPRGKEEGSVVSSNSVGISSYIFELEDADPTVVSSPKK
ncbi:hypothetical protein ACOSQ2_013129 [Xanthoceras sorbifolium]